VTVAGGVVLDLPPRRHGGDDATTHHLRALAEGRTGLIVASTLAASAGPVSLERLAPSGLLEQDQAREALVRLEGMGEGHRTERRPLDGRTRLR
jgi:hypothetical protein